MSSAFQSTTILCVRRDSRVAMAGDGQVTMGATVAKSDAVKVRQLPGLGAKSAGVLVGFAGSAADSCALLERFEAKLKDTPTNLTRAAIELAKTWRTDRALRRLEAMIIVADAANTFTLSGQGDVIEPSDGVASIGSGASQALAAARALLAHTQMNAGDICREAMRIAGEICIYSNTSVSVVDLAQAVQAGAPIMFARVMQAARKQPVGINLRRRRADNAGDVRMVLEDA